MKKNAWPDQIIAAEQLPAYQAAEAWIAQEPLQIPPQDVRSGLQTAFQIIQQLNALKTNSMRTFRQLLIALKIVSSSEKSRNATHGKGHDEPKKSSGKGNAIERLTQFINDSERLRRWHLGLANKHKKCTEKAKKRLEQMMRDDAEESDAPEPQLTPEQERLADEEFLQRCTLGGSPDPSLCSPSEPLMRGGWTNIAEQDEECLVDRSQLPPGAVIRKAIIKEHRRFDFDFRLTELNISTETLFLRDGKEDEAISTNTLAYGPARLQVTWNFLATMSILLSQFAIPMNRFAKMVSTHHKKFSAAEISRYYRHVANYFVPIYLHLSQSLANAPILCGDDTPSLVLEVERSREKIAAGEPPTWQSFATQSQARISLQKAHEHATAIQQLLARAVTPAEKAAAREFIVARSPGPKETLAMRLAAKLGFVSPLKSGKGPKMGLNTTVISGRSVAQDPQSTIVFYRTHLGSVGNLLDVILHYRDPKNKDLVIQSDFSTTNLVSDSQLISRYAIHFAGCASHARRPFAIHEADDPIFCQAILHAFKAIPIYEKLISLRGRNALNTVAVRNVDQRRNWEDIREYCETVCLKWSAKTALGEGARYILRHYEKLTYYLTDARISPYNNFCERMLRQEKLIRNNSLFRSTLDGRCSLDIMRSILQTALAAKVDPAAYLCWVMQTPARWVATSPWKFTPYAYALASADGKTTSPLD